MEKTSFPRKFRVYLPLILLFALTTVLLPRTSKFKYDYKKGEPWAYETLVSQFDFPILKTEAQLIQEFEQVGSRVIPYYRHEAAVASRSQDMLQAVDLGKYSDVKVGIASALSDIYSKGVLLTVRNDSTSSENNARNS